MEATQNEYQALEETLNETKRMSEEFNISLSDALLLRQLVCLRYLCNEKAKEKD